MTDTPPSFSKEMIAILQLLLFTTTILQGVIGDAKGICSICACSGKTINCRNEKLNHTFDPAMWATLNGSQYTEAFFSNNHIGHVTRFPTLSLVKLSYRNNRIVKIDDKAFKNLTSLEELDLSENELTSDNLLPVVFEGPYDVEFYEPLKLKLLDLSDNELHTLHQDLFEHLPQLERLYLKHNPLKIIDKSTQIAISSVPHLQVLDLSFTKLKELPTGFLHTPRNLHELVLKGNNFKEIPIDVLAENHDLRILNLNENPIKILSKERPFPEMPTLKQLHISFMPNLTRIEEGSLAGLTALDYLYCRMNEKLTFISPKAFEKEGAEAKWPDMVKLDISDNGLRYIDEELLRPVWKTIKHVNIMGNPLVCDCENQWIVSELVPLLIHTASPVEGLECAEPSPMKGKRLVTLSAKNYSMRCLDLYGNHPEHDGPILISIFVMIIISLLVILGLVIWLRTNICRRGGRTDYHRAFYRPTKLEDPDRY